MADQVQSGGDDGASGRWSTAEAWVVGIGAGLVIVALLGAAYTIGYNNGQSDSEPSAGQQQAAQEPEAEAEPPTADLVAGRELFAASCGSCHTLADAETSGTVGPGLDALQPEASVVEAAIRDGGAGTGAMPAGIYSGKEAEQVADYVAAVAGEG